MGEKITTFKVKGIEIKLIKDRKIYIGDLLGEVLMEDLFSIGL